MPELIACHECDLLQRRVSLPEKGAAKCPRCGTTLYKDKPILVTVLLFCVTAMLVLTFAPDWELLQPE